ncbi:inosine-uridine preferring nucleoside hydrolase domain-containing protein [Ditylenchus destructor]|uniref:Inosine-uridine preferring nucleoside hydrolase domain-containing protein n=1 Tax=Ditylenchus destructor TaxID=166010 RepID=A0AAD4NB42_9BILA|nr:inosine-uridine preferring nucleoside hydrolase domain-containing protein [Ditylenchus destructor]
MWLYSSLFYLFALIPASIDAEIKLIVMDCDGASDDASALTLALQHPNIEVLAVMTSSSSTNSSQAAVNIARTLRANNVTTKIPIYKGADGPLLRYPINYDFVRVFFGNDGFGDAPNEYPKVQPGDFTAHENATAAEGLIEIFRKNKKRNVTLVVTGSLTNVALALNLEPKFAEWPSRMVIMGGNVHAFSNVLSSSTAESNFYNDPEAAYIVLKEMKCNITLVSWESTLYAGENHEINFYTHLNQGTPLANFLAMATRKVREYSASSTNQYFYCDQVAIGVVINEVALITEAQYRRASVELYGQKTRGQVTIDWADRSNGKPSNSTPFDDYRPINFIVHYNVTYLDQLMFDAVNAFDNNVNKN